MRSTLRSRSGEVVKNSNQCDRASNSGNDTRFSQHGTTRQFEQETQDENGIFLQQKFKSWNFYESVIDFNR